jgi:hypothetical protein
VAIADIDGLGPQLGRRICRYNEGTAEEAQEQERGSEKPTGSWARPVPTRSTHLRMVQSFLQKTDSAGSLKIPLPGSWNGLKRPRDDARNDPGNLWTGARTKRGSFESRCERAPGQGEFACVLSADECRG